MWKYHTDAANAIRIAGGHYPPISDLHNRVAAGVFQRFQNTMLCSAGIGAAPQQAEIAHFHISRNGRFGAYVLHMHCLLLLYQTLITWMISALALESDSMRSRSSLLRGRTAFSIYRFDNRDRAFVIALFSCITLTAMGVILGASQM